MLSWELPESYQNYQELPELAEVKTNPEVW